MNRLTGNHDPPVMAGSQFIFLLLVEHFVFNACFFSFFLAVFIYLVPLMLLLQSSSRYRKYQQQREEKTKKIGGRTRICRFVNEVDSAIYLFYYYFYVCFFSFFCVVVFVGAVILLFIFLLLFFKPYTPVSVAAFK